MTRGSWIHDDVSRHFDKCAQCRDTRPEDARLAQPPDRSGNRLTVPFAVLAQLCEDGRSIYRSYLQWLAEPDW
jgi:hypothetical protein